MVSNISTRQWKYGLKKQFSKGYHHSEGGNSSACVNPKLSTEQAGRVKKKIGIEWRVTCETSIPVISPNSQPSFHMHREAV